MAHKAALSTFLLKVHHVHFLDENGVGLKNNLPTITKPGTSTKVKPTFWQSMSSTNLLSSRHVGWMRGALCAFFSFSRRPPN